LADGFYLFAATLLDKSCNDFARAWHDCHLRSPCLSADLGNPEDHRRYLAKDQFILPAIIHLREIADLGQVVFQI